MYQDKEYKFCFVHKCVLQTHTSFFSSHVEIKPQVTGMGFEPMITALESSIGVFDLNLNMEDSTVVITHWCMGKYPNNISKTNTYNYPFTCILFIVYI